MVKAQFTWDGIKALMRCRLRYTLQFVSLQADTKMSIAALEGVAVHQGLGNWWRLSGIQRRADREERCMIHGWEHCTEGAEWGSGADELRAMKRVVDAGVCAIQVCRDEGFVGRDLCVEESFAVVFRQFILRGRADLYIDMEDGEHALVDYKYSSNERSGNRLQLIAQAIGLHDELDEWPMVAGFLYCGLRTQSFKRIRFNHQEVEKFGDKLEAAWEKYIADPRAPTFNPHSCDSCPSLRWCDTYQEAHPGVQKGDHVYGHKQRIDI